MPKLLLFILSLKSLLKLLQHITGINELTARKWFETLPWLIDCSTVIAWCRQWGCQWGMRHGLWLAVFPAVWLAGQNIDRRIHNKRYTLLAGISTVLQRPVAVPLHSPNGRQMPAVRAVQGDCGRVYMAYLRGVGMLSSRSPMSR